MNDPKHKHDFDFDHLAELAQRAPEDFETVRRRMIAQIIDSAPEASRRRLNGLQWQVDMVRDRAGTPMGACVEISRMMWDSVAGEGGLLESIQRLTDPAEANPPPLPAPGEVLRFTPSTGDRERDRDG